MDPYFTALAAARSRITEVDPADVDPDHAVLIDVREPHELAVGVISGAEVVRMRELRDKIAQVVREPNTPIVLYCAIGERSAIAAAMLEDLGYRNVVSLAGGIKRWMAAGLPTSGDSELTEQQRHRYARHIVLPAVGTEGQSRLLEAKVAIVGAGGLGSPAALYLASAGIGSITVVDQDMVELSNLQRQLLHDTSSVGMPKTESAARRLRAVNPEVSVVTHNVRLGAGNAREILSGHNVIIDATDNFAARYLINDVSLHLQIPVVHGSIFRFEGQVSVFQPYRGPCYRCLFPQPPPAELAPNCAEAGVFGVLPGVIGTMQATEAIKLILGLGTPLVGKLLTYDGLDQSMLQVEFSRDPDCISCGNEGEPPELRDEADYC